MFGSGQKVQPEELKAPLFEHPDIREGCIIGMPATRAIEQGSEEVCATVVASDSAVSRFAGNLEQLETALRGNLQQPALGLAAFKRPTRIIVCKDPMPHPTTLACLLHAAAALTLTARREERRLADSTFGDDYRRYLAANGRFLPRLCT